MNKIITGLAIVLLTATLSQPAIGDDNEYNRASLKGISGVLVLVEGFE